jgi:hypothetical protein
MPVLLGGLFTLGLSIRAIAAADLPKEEIFKLRGVSVFGLSGRGGSEAYFLRGQSAECQDKPFAEVKAYPAFKSPKPIYGSVRFAGEASDRKNTGLLFYYALDESQGAGQGYDRLYFDLNRDLDLRNDTALAPQANPPEAAKQAYSGVKQQVIFEPLLVSFDWGAAGTHKVQLIPRLTISVYEKEEYKQISFIRSRAYEGQIKVAGEAYDVLLGNDYFISGRLDHPGAALVLTPKQEPRNPVRWWGGDRLMALHKIKGDYYSFSANPTGDHLTLHPYTGELGTFEVGPGPRKLDKLTVNGSLQGEDRAVAVGGRVEDGWANATRSCRLPTGDYLPSYLTLEYGRLRISLSQNYHSEGGPRDRGGRAPVYALHIRKDQPCVLDFSNKPDVMFACPTNAQRVKAGELLSVKAVLVDPRLDIMIRGLDDTSRKQTQGPDGKALGYERNLSLDPKVRITRANGELVAEGVMPFG